MELETLHKEVTRIYSKITKTQKDVLSLIDPEIHLKFLFTFLKKHGIYHYFDIQKPWLIYWTINSIAIFLKLNFLSYNDRKKLSEYLLLFQNMKTGGFAGGINYQSNILTNYAVILSLSILNIKTSWKKIDRKKMYNFFLSLKKKNGSFLMHEKGESDLRCVYAVLVVSKFLNILDNKLKHNIFEFIQQCQTYEGGFGPTPNVEAHGGYSFCGIASLSILNRIDDINVNKLLYWLSNKQKKFYGGFCGRTNKLVDSCYSFWQASIYNILKEHKKKYTYKNNLLYNQTKLQKYLLYCCQEKNEGGFKDKPGKRNDIYHTNYSLLGLALSTNNQNFENLEKNDQEFNKFFNWDYFEVEDMDPVFAVPRFASIEFVKAFENAEKIQL